MDILGYFDLSVADAVKRTAWGNARLYLVRPSFPKTNYRSLLEEGVHADLMSALGRLQRPQDIFLREHQAVSAKLAP